MVSPSPKALGGHCPNVPRGHQEALLRGRRSPKRDKPPHRRGVTAIRPIYRPAVSRIGPAGHQAARGAHATDNRRVTNIDRPLPPLNADERTTLESWLDFHRATLAMKCEGLDDDQAATASVPPSGFTLTGLVRHMAEVERNWFRRVLAGEHAGPIFDPEADPDGPDGGFELAEGGTLPDALAIWRTEIARARERCAARALTDTGRFMEQDVSLRWIYVHMIEEYARHNGHADLVRERIDGTTGA
jgi:uncharacterized damage-inducible protein DinB